MVDDNDFCRNAVVRLLERYERKVMGCIDGFQALAEIKQNLRRYNFAIIDYQMPGMNGIKLIQEIRECERNGKENNPMFILCKFIK